jgi:hypothetical protein
MRKIVFLIFALLSLVLMGFDESKMKSSAPAEVERFAEENYEEILDIGDSNAAAFNFTIGDQNVTIGRVIPENRLEIDKQLNITVETPVQWVVPVYQSDAVKNVIDIWEPSIGKYEIAGIGYPYWLTFNLTNLESDEYYLSNRQYDLEFAYSPSKNRVRPLGDSSIRLLEENGQDPNGITKSEFVAFLKQHFTNNYPDRFNDESQSWYPYVFGGIITAFFLISGFIFLTRKKRPMNG